MLDQEEQTQIAPAAAEGQNGERLAQETTAGLAPAVENKARALWQRLLPHVTVLAAMTVVTIIATWPMFPQLGGYVLDKGDPLYSVWAMAWQAHAIATNPLHLFDANNMYPFQGTLTFDELSFMEAVMAAPFYWLTGNPVLSHNLVLFASFVLSGYGVWYLVRDLTKNSWAGVVAGMAFAFSFYRMNHLPHITLDSTEWLPFVLLSAYRLLQTRSWRWAWALAAFFTMQSLSGHYLAFYSAMLLGVFFLFYLLAQRSLFSWAMFGKLAVGMVASLVVMLPILVPYATIQGENNFARNLFETERFSNTLSSFLAVFRGNPIYQVILSPFADPGFWSIERSAFPGLTVVVLGVLAVTWARRQARREREVVPVEAPPRDRPESARRISLAKHAAFYALVAILSAFLSLGPTLQVTYATSLYDPNSIHGIMPLPYRLLHDWVPGFQTMRVVARIGVLTALALSVLAGIGAFFVLHRVGQRWHLRRRLVVPAVAVLLAFLPVFESWSAPVSMAAVGTRDAVPPVYKWLAQQPHTVIVEYPMVRLQKGDPNVEMENLYQYYSAYHWQDTVNGSTTIRPFSYSALVQETENCFPCPRSLDALSALGVKYVVVHLANLSAPQRTDFLWRSTNQAGKVVGDFNLVQDFGSDRVYELKSPRDISKLKDLITSGSSVLLGDPGLDPERIKGGLVYGGYMAAMGYYLRDFKLYGDSRLSFGETIDIPQAGNRTDYALLWANQDPRPLGFSPSGKLWSNEFVALYKINSPGARNP